mmetsp:Transcript_8656/g.10219  ORF Transcript_8656/g.10219 Transcript_8656/m.10219 type:complete len:121 (-) Transcript_8656:7-369(-)
MDEPEEKARFRVCTYNVLCSSLCNVTVYSFCKPENVHPEVRWIRLMEKLEDEVNRQAIICLQEVSALWEGRLHRFFSSNEYYYIHSGYGSKYSDYMGVGIAFSLKKIPTIEFKCSYCRRY